MCRPCYRCRGSRMAPSTTIRVALNPTTYEGDHCCFEARLSKVVLASANLPKHTLASLAAGDEVFLPNLDRGHRSYAGRSNTARLSRLISLSTVELLRILGMTSGAGQDSVTMIKQAATERPDPRPRSSVGNGEYADGRPSTCSGLLS